MLGKYHTLYIEATRKCNFSCKYCSSGSNGIYKEEKELTYDEIIEKILIPGYELGTRFVDFSGGEFLLREDAFELLDFSNKKGFKIGIASNGSTLDEKNILKLKKILGDNILISLGVNSFDDKNKDTRDVETEFTLKTINKLEQHNVNMNICVTMGSFNCDSFANTIKNIRELNLPFNRIPFVPRNVDNREYMFDKKIMKEKLHPALRKYYHGYVSYVPFFLDPEKYEKISGQKLKENKLPTNPSVGCWCGSFYSINPVGDVAPCPLLGDNLSGGNIREQNLSDILYKSELFTKIVERDKFEGKCGNCKYTNICGGCRAYSYYLTGNVFGSDPTCFIDELSESELKEMEEQVEKNFKNYTRMAKFGGLYYSPKKTK